MSGAACRVTVVTGLSGAGRSTALNVLEDLGYYCVDNLPPSLAPQLIERVSGSGVRQVGLGIDVRSGRFLDAAIPTIDMLVEVGHHVEVIFLDCAEPVLLRRFSETRRPHKLAAGGDVAEAVRLERERLADLRERADIIFDTTTFSVHDLRRALVSHLSRGGEGPWRMVTRLLSFGFKHGLPAEANLVFDVRYLPNPHFEPDLRPHSGHNPDVAAYVLGSPEGRELVEKIEDLLRTALPGYESEGKAYLTIAIGCTGGRHRSVAIAEELGRRLAPIANVVVYHRDIERSG
ncbi:MAG: RNase adapter RapZ [Myxococcales bacterium]|nr:RNase adapter RapZ [Myxococcales bacterium]